MTGFGYAVLGFGSHPSRGPAALSITLNKANLEPLNFIGGAGSNVDTNAGEIDVTAAAAGGDTSGDGYAYAWTLTEVTDTGNQLSVLAAGTQNTAQYNSLTLRAVPAGGPPAEVMMRLTCTVTDDAGTTAAVNILQPGVIIAA